MSIEAYPLQWPAGHERTAPHKRARSMFRRNGRQLTVADARGSLMDQIRMFTRTGRAWRIDPDKVVISSNMPVRQDGLPYSGRRDPDDPGVAVYFHLDKHPYAMPCDTWDSVADNIYAVAKHLEAMRGIERWGVGSLKTAFAGFNALPPGSGDRVQTAFTADSAAHFLANVIRTGYGPSAILSSHEAYRLVYRTAAAKLHPDRGGDPSQFLLLQEAKRVLDLHHGRNG